MIRRCMAASGLVICLMLATLALAQRQAGERGFTRIFDGKSLKGWRISDKTGHGTGGKWVVESGAIVGSQDRPGNGGILITEKQYGDFEVALEMNNDYGPDSGLFLRSNDRGQAYQAMIDYHAGGNLMGVYGEGIGGCKDDRIGRASFKPSVERKGAHAKYRRHGEKRSYGKYHRPDHRRRVFE